LANQWYPHYPGDYERDTAHLKLAEHGAYRLLLDHYYSAGGPPPPDKERLYRVCRAFDLAERAAVDTVLAQFFVLRENGYHNGRADRELLKRSEQRSRLSESGRRGADRRWKSPAGRSGDGHANGHPNGLAMARPQPQPDPQLQPTPEPHSHPTLVDHLQKGAEAPALLRPSPSAFAGAHLNVSEKQDRLLAEAFPWVDRPPEYRKADAWLEANRQKRPRKQESFIHNWFSRVAAPPSGAKGAVRAEERTRHNLAAAGFSVH
jgi:uncharacterized protein YdaU (DUF1376 family)